jgi:hypothetical protein
MVYNNTGEIMNQTVTGSRFSNVNGKSTKVGKKLTTGSVDFIIRKAGKIPGKSIAAILHRPLKTVQSAASLVGVSLRLN